jgi:hypothetical protein
MVPVKQGKTIHDGDEIRRCGYEDNKMILPEDCRHKDFILSILGRA